MTETKKKKKAAGRKTRESISIQLREDECARLFAQCDASSPPPTPTAMAHQLFIEGMERREKPVKKVKATS